MNEQTTVNSDYTWKDILAVLSGKEAIQTNNQVTLSTTTAITLLAFALIIAFAIIVARKK